MFNHYISITIILNRFRFSLYLYLADILTAGMLKHAHASSFQTGFLLILSAFNVPHLFISKPFLSYTIMAALLSIWLFCNKQPKCANINLYCIIRHSFMICPYVFLFLFFHDMFFSFQNIHVYWRLVGMHTSNQFIQSNRSDQAISCVA